MRVSVCELEGIVRNEERRRPQGRKVDTHLERYPLGSVGEFYLGKLGKKLVRRNQTESWGFGEKIAG